MQLSFYYMMPTLLLTGFMFPYSGMPEWAQWISTTLPMTYFIRGARGVFLKEFSLLDMWPNLWPIGVAFVVFLWASIKSYRKTLS
jgi:ABC-2 type transport system permease protein